MALFCPDLLSHIILGLAAAYALTEVSDAASEIPGGFIDFSNGDELPALILYDLAGLKATPLKFVARLFLFFAVSEIV